MKLFKKMCSGRRSAAMVLSVALSCLATTQAQELTPRAFWPAPNGTNALISAYQYTTGDIVTDPSLPVTGVDSEINFAQVGWQRFFGLFDRTASLQLNLPYSWGLTEGVVDGVDRSRKTSGVGDARVRLAVNLLGAPVMDPSDFQALRANPHTIVGASLLIQMPTGDYASDKLINIGTNRWAAKPALGAIWPLSQRWLLEAEVGVWLFGDNNDFLGGSRRQDPILSTEFHLVRRIRPGFWASLDANFYVGGRTSVDGIEGADLQRNSRFGATLVWPFKRGQAVRASYSTGVVTETGGDFDSVSLSYVFLWR